MMGHCQCFTGTDRRLGCTSPTPASGACRRGLCTIKAACHTAWEQVCATTIYQLRNLQAGKSTAVHNSSAPVPFQCATPRPVAAKCGEQGIKAPGRCAPCAWRWRHARPRQAKAQHTRRSHVMGFGNSIRCWCMRLGAHCQSPPLHTVHTPASPGDTNTASFIPCLRYDHAHTVSGWFCEPQSQCAMRC